MENKQMSSDAHKVKEVQHERRDNSTEFRRELKSLINRYSRENASNTPDHILMEFMWGCLCAFDQGTRARDNWHGNFLGKCGPSDGESID